MKRKTVCVRIPRFRTSLETKERPEWRSLPLAIFEPLAKDRRLVEVSLAAEAAGIRLGMAFKEAQLRCPQGVYLPDAPEKYEAAFDGVLETLDCFSPSVEDSGVDLAFIDATGLERLYGSDSSLCERVRREIYERLGQTAYIGLATGKFAAEIAALTSKEAGSKVVNSTDREFLSPQSVDLLPLPEQALEQLRLLGVRTMGEYAALPRNSVRLRYGIEGSLAWRLAQGDDRRPVEGRERPLVLSDEVRFEWEEHNLDRLTFALQGLSERLAARLRSRGKMSRRMRADIGRSDGVSKSFTLNLPEPSAQARTFRDAVRWYLDASEASREPTSSLDEMPLDEPGVEFIRMQVDELSAFEGKAIGLLPNRADRLERANRALSRLRVELGEGAVYRIKLCLEERLPERAFCKVGAYFEDTDFKKSKLPARNSYPPEERYAAGSGGMLRLFDKPLQARLVEGGPYSLINRHSPESLSRGDGDHLKLWEGVRRLEFAGVSRKVVACRGPHKLTSEWWEEPYERDYFRVSLDGGMALLIYHDLRSGRWYAQGTID